MEYKNMRMVEIKSPTRERRLRSYSQMRKAELVAFFDHLGWNYSPLCGGQTAKLGKARASDKTCVISQFSGSNPPEPT